MRVPASLQHLCSYSCSKIGVESSTLPEGLPPRIGMDRHGFSPVQHWKEVLEQFFQSVKGVLSVKSAWWTAYNAFNAKPGSGVSRSVSLLCSPTSAAS